MSFQLHVDMYIYKQGCHSVRKSQEKLKKMTKVRKSQEKMGGFEKRQEKSGNLIKLKKKSDFVILYLQNSLFSKALKL